MPMLPEILLVVLFSWPEVSGRQNPCHDRPAKPPGSIHTFPGRMSLLLLLCGMGENSGSVLAPDIRALPVLCRWVVNYPALKSGACNSGVTTDIAI
ncbi:MAG: hypothetical protein XE11_1404 [Methanomicrobiales archaeon 53_19]|nr:MAG: hypothetical protein XE11_1404 [Methanomicrobiales archaeon 53_19]